MTIWHDSRCGREKWGNVLEMDMDHKSAHGEAQWIYRLRLTQVSRRQDQCKYHSRSCQPRATSQYCHVYGEHRNCAAVVFLIHIKCKYKISIASIAIWKTFFLLHLLRAHGPRPQCPKRKMIVLRRCFLVLQQKRHTHTAGCRWQ